MNKFFLALPVLALVAACHGNSGNNASGSTSGAQITGAGSTFVYPVLSAWAADYQKQAGTAVNYQSIGSGGGISQVEAGTVDFGATDQPLASDELAKNNLAQFPVVVGGIVPVVNIAGLDAGKLKLTGPILADIYQGKIKTWNDPAIVKINPGLNLPSSAIAAVHRSDGSGTTFNFTHYLSQVSPTWKAGPGEGKTVNWTGGVGGKGNEGVAGYVKQLPNSLGYVEYAYVVQNKMTYALLQNSAGQFVAPSAASFAAAAANRGLEEREGLQPGYDQRDGRSGLSNRCEHLHPYAQAAEGQGALGCWGGLFQICAREGSGSGQQARLCPVAR